LYAGISFHFKKACAIAEESSGILGWKVQTIGDLLEGVGEKTVGRIAVCSNLGSHRVQ
jgi:hypothetical protein